MPHAVPLVFVANVIVKFFKYLIVAMSRLNLLLGFLLDAPAPLGLSQNDVTPPSRCAIG